MDLEFTPAEVAYLRNLKGFYDLKQRDAAAAQQLATEAAGLLQEYLKSLAAARGLAGQKLELRPDLLGFELGDRHVDRNLTVTGGTTTRLDT